MENPSLFSMEHQIHNKHLACGKDPKRVAFGGHLRSGNTQLIVSDRVKSNRHPESNGCII